MLVYKFIINVRHNVNAIIFIFKSGFRTGENFFVSFTTNILKILHNYFTHETQKLICLERKSIQKFKSFTNFFLITCEHVPAIFPF